jgi:hypothetical protein
VQGGLVERAPLGQEIAEERLDVLIDPAFEGRDVPAADHRQVLHQVRMKALAEIE